MSFGYSVSRIPMPIRPAGISYTRIPLPALYHLNAKNMSKRNSHICAILKELTRVTALWMETKKKYINKSLITFCALVLFPTTASNINNSHYYRQQQKSFSFLDSCVQVEGWSWVELPSREGICT
ncbi:hypothetical protein AVEN_160124-1 [Araneus ventricosus]|uniref:Uncharacterized protein n=1 Tax=Araneus ventricosus TaxID=182803 RepID=A0A4Y2KCX4_ARAVE|nr:hypothetical protein AVEN_160124-1 [Araneus ventricosus]